MSEKPEMASRRLVSPLISAGPDHGFISSLYTFLFTASTLATGVMVMANIAGTVGLVLMNKRVFVVHKFQFPSFVILLHQVCVGAGCAWARRVGRPPRVLSTRQ